MGTSMLRFTFGSKHLKLSLANATVFLLYMLVKCETFSQNLNANRVEMLIFTKQETILEENGLMLVYLHSGFI